MKRFICWLLGHEYVFVKRGPIYEYLKCARCGDASLKVR